MKTLETLATSAASVSSMRAKKGRRIMAFLEVNQVKKSFGQGDTRVEVLRGIDLTVEKGKLCVLLGPSGSGKSPLLNIIGGIDGPDSGSVAIAKEKIEDMNEKKLSLYRRKHLGYVFQQYNLIANLTVKENIEVGAYLSDAPLDVAASSRERLSAEPSSKILTFFFAMSRQGLWIIKPPRRSWS